MDLAAWCNFEDRSELACELLLAAGDKARTTFLQWLILLPSPIAEIVMARAVPLLSDKSLPARLRIFAAIRILRHIPDRMSAVRPVVKALVRGVSSERALVRLRFMQNRLAGCATLDTLISRRENRLKMDCPRCDIRLARPRMICHLWEQHALHLVDSRVTSILRWDKDLEAKYRESPSPEIIESAVFLSGTQGLRRWVAHRSNSDDLDILRAAAKYRLTGLCPSCGSEISPALLPIPSPLVLSHGRLVGEGYEVSIGKEWWAMLRIAKPKGRSRHPLGWKQRFTRRPFAAMILYTTALFSVIAAGSMVPGFTLWAVVCIAFALSACLITASRPFDRKRLSIPDQLIDAAWIHVAPRLVKKVIRTDYLTRLCRASYGRGNPDLRMRPINDIIERAEQIDNPENLQLLAAAKVLFVFDGAEQGRDLTAGIAVLVKLGWAKGLSLTHLEYILECYLGSEPAPRNEELCRLKMLLLAIAFEEGLKPNDLLDLWGCLPTLQRAMLIEPTHRLSLFYGLYSIAASQPWMSIGHAETIFDYARNSPTSSGKLIEKYPDLLLIHRADATFDSTLGPILICCRGVAFGGHLAADPAAIIEQQVDGLVLYGSHRFQVDHRLSNDFLALLRQWLKFRTSILIPFIDAYRDASSPEILGRILQTILTSCPYCRSNIAVRVGKVGISGNIYNPGQSTSGTKWR